jgi:hypothetical protein
MTNQELLIIDDSPDIHELVTLWLAEEPLDFFSSATGSPAPQPPHRMRRRPCSW